MKMSQSKVYRVVLLLIFMGWGLTLHAADRYWNVSVGDWNTASNWKGNAVPGASDVGYVNNGGTATMTSATTLTRISVAHSDSSCSGTLVIDADGATISNTSSMTVGRNAGSGVLQMKNGTLDVTGTAVIGGCDVWHDTNSALVEQVGGTVNFKSTVRVAGKAAGGKGEIRVSNGTMTIAELTSAVNDSGAALNNKSTGLLSVSGNGVVTVNNFKMAKGSTIRVSENGSLTMKADTGTISNGVIQVTGGTLTINGLKTAQTFTDTSLEISGGTVYWKIDSSANNNVFTNLTTTLTGGTLDVTGKLKNYNSTLIVAGGNIKLNGTESFQSGSSGAGTFTFVGSDYSLDFYRWGLGTPTSGKNKIAFLATSEGIGTVQGKTTGTDENFLATDVQAGLAGGLAVMDASTYTLIISTGLAATGDGITLDNSSVWKAEKTVNGKNMTVSASLDTEQKKGTITLTGSGMELELLDGVTLGSKGWFEVQGNGDLIDYPIGLALLENGVAMTDTELLSLSNDMNADAYGYLETEANDGILWMKNLDFGGLEPQYFAYDFTPYGTGITVSGIRANLAVPEPASWLLILLGIGWVFRRRK